ncbi:hypothetical protein SDC9_124319 [bioreactor metagenome]|uniref:Uncharacterized protein n=1 Tax=bioreactor metagenome TaxID=1076179 RepID=A0A645CK30_9ZZZZ
MAAALEDQHHVIGRAAAGAGEHRLHRARSQILAAVLRIGGIGRTIHRQDMAAARLCHKAHS